MKILEDSIKHTVQWEFNVETLLLNLLIWLDSIILIFILKRRLKMNYHQYSSFCSIFIFSCPYLVNVILVLIVIFCYSKHWDSSFNYLSLWTPFSNKKDWRKESKVRVKHRIKPKSYPLKWTNSDWGFRKPTVSTIKVSFVSPFRYVWLHKFELEKRKKFWRFFL